ncbi:MAG: hypothetical protein WAZ60_23945 [Desulfosalsimonadaceae bacterium]
MVKKMIKLRTTGTTTITSGTIALSQSYTSEAYDATQLQGFFSLQWTVTGDGTMKAEVLVSNDGVTFHDLDSDITTGQTKSTGTGGVNMADFEVTPCNQIKIKFTETGGANSIAVVAKLRAC